MQELHWSKLRQLCLDKGLDISHISGPNSKQQYINLLKESNMAQALVISPTDADLKAVNIDKETIRLDHLKANIDALMARVKVRSKEYGLQMVERKFNNGQYRYIIDRHENTIHFLGGTLGPICTNLTTPDKLILRIAHNYLNANTIKGHDLMVEERN